jgi:hypothetical protein
MYLDLAMFTGLNNNLTKSAYPSDQAFSVNKLAIAYRKWVNKELQLFNI